MYRRTTRTMHLGDAPAALRDALVRHAGDRQLPLTGARAWLTHSVNLPSETFLGKLLGRRANPVDPDVEHWTLVVLTATHVLVATHGPRRGTPVLDVPLPVASVQRGIADGMLITGYTGTLYVGLGPEAAARECFAAIATAIPRAAQRLTMDICGAA